MDQLLLFADRASFTMSAGGSVSGVIAFRFCEEFFPEDHWNDLVLPICASWLESLIRIVRDETQSETVRFMDGPFLARLTRSENAIAVDLVESRRRGDVVRHRALVNAEPLLENAILTGTEILNECYLREWRNPDVATLNHLLAEASTAYRRSQWRARP